MIRIKTALAGGYSVLLGRGIVSLLAQLMEEAKLTDAKRVMLVSDDNVFPLYGQTVRELLTAAGYEVYDFVFPAGEAHKDASTLNLLWEALAEHTFTKKDVLAALGGGIAGDLTGFAASSYLMGVRYIQLPTSLLSMVDSSLGGRTGISLKNNRRLIGAGWHPSLIVCDTAFLDTLPEETFSDGMAEVIKYAMIDSDEIRALIMKDTPDIEKIIALSVYAKKEKYESGNDDEMKLLNFGHTVATAIEHLSDNAVSHGKAVAMGMMMSTRASVKMGLCVPRAEKILSDMLKKYSLPTESVYTEADIADFTVNDKMHEGETVHLVLPEKAGRCVLRQVNIEDYKKYLNVT